MVKRLSKKTRLSAKVDVASAALEYDGLIAAIGQAHESAQHQAVQATNVALTLRNWVIGHYIVEYEQHGRDRAKYGDRLLESLATDLRKRLGRGFGARNLLNFREFYLCYPISQSLIAEFVLLRPASSKTGITRLAWQDDAYFERLFQQLPWTHFNELIRIDDPLKRAFYEIEIVRNRWSVRELKRQLDSLLFERVGLSRDAAGVMKVAQEGVLVTSPEEMIRDPYVFEFLGLKREERYTESQLEQALIDNLQEFLLELGQGFCFVARQRRITFDNEHYHIDLLLYNRKLKCLVAVDLILGHFRHEYAGAMNFYLNYLKAAETETDERPPVGILLCSDKNETHVEYALGGLSNRIFVSRYVPCIPSKEELEAFVQRTRRRLGR